MHRSLTWTGQGLSENLLLFLDLDALVLSEDAVQLIANDQDATTLVPALQHIHTSPVVLHTGHLIHLMAKHSMHSEAELNTEKERSHTHFHRIFSKPLDKLCLPIEHSVEGCHHKTSADASLILVEHQSIDEGDNLGRMNRVSARRPY